MSAETPKELKTAAQVLRAIAGELAKRAKDAMPRLREGERILREWYADGVYYREAVLDGESRISQYDFREAAEQAAMKAEDCDEEKATA